MRDGVNEMAERQARDSNTTTPLASRGAGDGNTIAKGDGNRPETSLSRASGGHWRACRRLRRVDRGRAQGRVRSPAMGLFTDPPSPLPVRRWLRQGRRKLEALPAVTVGRVSGSVGASETPPPVRGQVAQVPEAKRYRRSARPGLPQLHPQSQATGPRAMAFFFSPVS